MIDPPPSRPSPHPRNLLHLPRDIRDNIYRQLFLRRNPLTPLHYIHSPMTRYFRADDHQTLLCQSGVRLMRTCKTVCNEAAEVLYGCNTFCLRPNRAEEILKFFHQIGSHNLSIMKSLIVNFEYEHELFPSICDIVQTNAGGEIWSLNEARLEFRQLENNVGLRKAQLPRFKKMYMKEVEKYRTDFREPFPFDYDWIWEDDIDFDLIEDTYYEWWPEILREGLESWTAVQQTSQNLGILEDRPFPERLSGSVEPIVEVLAQCKELRRLEICFPDAQRFKAGHLQRGTRKCLKKIQSLTQISHLTVRGISNLAALECMASSMNLSRMIAELGRSRRLPFLHVESGRPDLRMYPKWQILRSNRYEISFELILSETPMKDSFSGLPAEIRASIYKYSILHWQKDFHPGFKGWYDGNILDCSKPNPEWQLRAFRKKGEGLSTGFAALLKVSSLIHRETSPVMYRRLSNFCFANLRRNNLSSMAADEEKNDINRVVKFLESIGSTNRRYIRSLDICFNSWIRYPSNVCHEASIDDIREAARASQRRLLDRLVELIQGIPILDTLRFVQTEDARKITYKSYTLPSRREWLGEYIKDLSFYLTPISKLRLSLRHLSMTGFVMDRVEAECFGRLIGAETMEHGFYPKKLRAEAKKDGWKFADEFIQKQLTPENLSMEVASGLEAAKVSGSMKFSFMVNS